MTAAQNQLEGLIRQMQRLEGQGRPEQIAVIYDLRRQLQAVAGAFRREAMGPDAGALARVRQAVARDLVRPMDCVLRGGGALAGMREQIAQWKGAAMLIGTNLRDIDLDSRGQRAPADLGHDDAA